MALQTINPTGRSMLDLSAAAVAADAGLSDWWIGNGQEMVYVENGGGSPINLTLTWGTGGGLIDGQAAAARVLALAAGKRVILGPFPLALFQNTTNSRITLTWSAITSVKLYVFTLGN